MTPIEKKSAPARARSTARSQGKGKGKAQGQGRRRGQGVQPGRGRGRPTDVDAASTRAALLEAARVCFAQTSYRSTTVAAIAEAAGYSANSIYNHFSSKAELFAVAYTELDASFEAPMRAAVEGVDDVMGAVVSMVLAGAAIGRDHPSYLPFLAAVPLEVLRNQELSEVLPLVDGVSYRVLRDVFDAARQRGELRDDASAQDLARSVAIFLVGVTSHSVVHGGPDALSPDLVGAIFAIISNGILAPAPRNAPRSAP